MRYHFHPLDGQVLLKFEEIHILSTADWSWKVIQPFQAQCDSVS